MRLAYLVVAVLPLAAVVALSAVVIRAISVRVVWRGTNVGRLDDEPA